ncbi:hypothetical protein CC77DRAFT_216186 [Alternaria alternata]|uniref:Uncharacterized protein n=1 Tax=Alternaria alternata TaxID=5599 RepID=A0A177DGA2_ALTAL|nr:hypothetical protein CC77DRAFT_216186 [Alternaria alternata]KAH6858413.1 hypothetical protein B0T12DRAFT_159312 [Alternaria alternata]OAG18210.1 hypothetical protein CC77DRAFT_216186 [Alternaria alternata]
MRLASSQPHRSGILNSCVPALIALVVHRLPNRAEARQICDTTATVSNPPPTVRASNTPAVAPSQVRITKISPFLQAINVSPSAMPRAGGWCFAMCATGLQALQCQQFHAWI